MKKRYEILCDRRGETYIEIAVSVLIFVFILVFILSSVSYLSAASYCDRVAKALCEAACVRGSTDIGDLADEILGENKYGLSFDFSGSDLLDPSGQVQLGDVIVVTVTGSFRFAGFGEFRTLVPLKATSEGVSRVYWK